MGSGTSLPGMPDSLIHLRVQAATKARWVRASRADGMRLTDWIINHIEAAMSHTAMRVAVPDDLRFADLKLARESAGDLSFNAAPLQRIADASGEHIARLLQTEDGLSALIVAWYAVARGMGEPPDPVAEDIAAEMRAEDAACQRFSLPPGRA